MLECSIFLWICTQSHEVHQKLCLFTKAELLILTVDIVLLLFLDAVHHRLYQQSIVICRLRLRF